MKTKLNFLLIGVFMLSSFAITFVSCDKDDDNDAAVVNTVVGKWYLYQETNEITYGDEYYEYSWTYDLNVDVDYFGADIYEITSNKLFVYENESGMSYFADEAGEYVIQNGMMITSSTDGSEEYVDTVNYAFENGMLVFSDSYEEEDGHEKYKTYLKKYTGTIPPASWIEELPADKFEPDNDMQTANDIAVGETTEMHSTTTGDADWYKFNAQAGKTYLIHVSGYVDGYLNLYDADGTTHIDEDDDNNHGVDVETSYWGNPVILWDCSSSGTYYFKVRGLGDSEEGYYNVSITESNLQKTSLKSERKVKRNSKPLFK